jgi:hypothetical protein
VVADCIVVLVKILHLTNLHAALKILPCIFEIDIFVTLKIILEF